MPDDRWLVQPYEGTTHGPGSPPIASVIVPGDKSISHRALLLNMLALSSQRALGPAAAFGPMPRVRGLLESEDVLRTKRACEQLSGWTGEAGGDVQIDCGNSGTTARLLLGALANWPGGAVRRVGLYGDASLSRRPMRRVLAPLSAMGAVFDPVNAATLPLAVSPSRLHGIEWDATVASAQVKSAVLLAGLTADGPTIYREPTLSRDHTERMLRAMGADLTSVRCGQGVELRLRPGVLRPVDVDVPGDISSAAFWLVAACIVNVGLTLKGVGVNPTRTGVLDVLRAMGARIDIEANGAPLADDDGRGEPAGELIVVGPDAGQGCTLQGTEIGGSLIPRLIDEIPILAVAAAFAEGETVFRDAGELRVKESDRIEVVVAGLRTMGVEVDATADGMRIVGRAGRGRGGERLRGVKVNSHGDHRIAMAFAIAGLRVGAEIEDVACVATSYPGFFEQLRVFSPSSV